MVVAPTGGIARIECGGATLLAFRIEASSEQSALDVWVFLDALVGVDLLGAHGRATGPSPRSRDWQRTRMTLGKHAHECGCAHTTAPHCVNCADTHSHGCETAMQGYRKHHRETPMTARLQNRCVRGSNRCCRQSASARTRRPGRSTRRTDRVTIFAARTSRADEYRRCAHRRRLVCALTRPLTHSH